MRVVRTEEEIDRVENWAAEGIDKGSHYEGMSYEQGIMDMRRWDRQDDALRAKNESIEKTKRAIERERSAIARVENAEFPPCVQELIAEGTLTVWRKYPRFVFVKGAGRARIKFENGKLFASYDKTLTADEYAIFKNMCNVLAQKMREESIE